MASVNNVRALRILEIMQDYRNLLYSISQTWSNPEITTQRGSVYDILRQCHDEGHELLTTPFVPTLDSVLDDPEEQKKHLEMRVCCDSATNAYPNFMRLVFVSTPALADSKLAGSSHEPKQSFNGQIHDELSYRVDSRWSSSVFRCGQPMRHYKQYVYVFSLEFLLKLMIV